MHAKLNYAREAIRLKELEIEHLRIQHETQQKRFMLWTRLIAIVAYFWSSQ